MLNLYLQSFDHLVQRADSLEKTLILGCWERLKEGGEGEDRWWDSWMASPTQWTWVCTSSGRWWRTYRETWGAAIHGVANSQTWQSDQTTTNLNKLFLYSKKYLNIGFAHVTFHHFGGSKNGYIPGLHILYPFLLHYILADKKRSGGEIYIIKSMN